MKTINTVGAAQGARPARGTVIFYLQNSFALLLIFGLSLCAFGQTTIFYDNFSTSSNWIIGNFSPPDNWVIGTTSPSGANAIGIIQSTTSLNGFALFDSDLLCSGSQYAYLDRSGGTMSIDCSAYPYVIIQFEQYYRKGLDSTEIQVSNNDWASGSNFWFYPNNSLAQNAFTPNPDIVSIDISSAAANEPAVWFAIAFKSLSSGCEYAWMVDDFKVIGGSASPPVADFNANLTNINQGDIVSFTDISTNITTSWSWSFPGGTPVSSSLQNPTVTYNTPGTYDVTLTVNNNYGSNTLTKPGYITVSQIYTINQGGTVNTCSGTFYDSGGSGGNYGINENYTMTFCASTPGAQIQFNGTSFDVWTGDLLYVYDGPNTASPQISGSPFDFFNILPTTITSTNVCLTYRFTSDGDIFTTLSGWEANISCVYPPVTDFIANTTNINMGETVSFTDLSTNSPTSWSWSFPGGTPGSSISQNPTITYNTAGTYDVTLTATNADGSNTLTKTGYITVVDPCAVSTEVFLTDIAFYDQPTIQSTSFGSYFTTLPNSISYHPSNPKNYLEPGRYVRFKIRCKNLKSDLGNIVSGECRIRSNDPFITIYDSTSTLNNVVYNTKAWSINEFEIYISPSANNGYQALIDFIVIDNTTSKQYSTKCIPIPIKPLLFSPTTAGTIDDDSNPDSNGNNNNLCESGETIEFYPFLDNISFTLSADYVRGTVENTDGLSGINIWNNVPGVSGTVYSSGWWNYLAGSPQTINPNSQNMPPELDFVFDYTYTSTYMFNLYLVTGGGFYLFGGSNDRTLIQWTLPYTFNAGFPLAPDAPQGIVESVEQNAVNIYPNPTTGEFIIEMESPEMQDIQINVTNILGQSIYAKMLYNIKGFYLTKINLKPNPAGIYNLQIIPDLRSFSVGGNHNNIINRKIILNNN
ncbi:MAG: PKD domain-containing protein [Cytophagales bacterium]|nr:PKD domain-containing protein [Cytophagales bacterium]